MYPPSITSVSPAGGRTGEEFTLTGLRFGPTEELASVTLNGVVCPIVSWSNTQVTCTVPHTTSGTLTLTSKTNNVKDYGAVGSGAVDDTDAIQDAIDDLPTDGSILYFPAGTYKVLAPGAGTYTILSLADTNIKVMGDGIGLSTIKVANACPTHKWVLGPTSGSTDLTGLEICDLTFDHNIANNPITNEPETATWKEFTCGTFVGSDISIHDLEVINASSRNNIVVNTYNDVSQTVTGNNCVIDNIIASGIGDDPNHIAHDASFFYIVMNGYSISNCDLSCDTERLPGGQCAIEAHGTNYTIQNNIITNFKDGINVCGVDIEADDCLVDNNTITGCLRGIDIYSVAYGLHTTGYGLDGLEISNNDINVIIFGDGTDIGFVNRRSGIVVYPGADLDVNDLNIHDNTITVDAIETTSLGFENGDSLGIGGSLGSTVNLSNINVTDNVVTNFPNSGILFDAELDTFSVTGNILTNCGCSLNVGVDDHYRTPIVIRGHTTIDTVDVSDNVFVDNINPTRIVYDVYLRAGTSSTGLTVSGNSYSVVGNGVWVRHIHVHDDNAEPLITETIANFTPPTHLVDTSSAIADTAPSHYLITANGTTAPKDWTFEGAAADAFPGTVLNTQAGIIFTGTQTKSYTFTDTTPYRWYRIDITLNGGHAFVTDVFELVIVRSGNSWTTADGLTWIIGLVPVMTSNVLPVPFVASASDADAGNPAYMIFDKVLDYAHSCQINDVTGWLKIDLGA